MGKFDPLTTHEVAEMAGIKSTSVLPMVYRGYMPPPDGKLGRTVWWHRDTIKKWMKGRKSKSKKGS